VAKFSVEGEGPVFQVLELAEVPDMKDGPSRAVLCIITTCVAFILSIVFVLVRHTVRKIRNDPEAMKKIAGPR
jgi:LPS O-antigen subunit length determinant protein (WzzB/FepE family)